jgi:hypothetical protein
MSIDPEDAGTLEYWHAAQQVQINSLYLDDADIDFDNSFIHKSNIDEANAGTAKATATITFLY